MSKGSNEESLLDAVAAGQINVLEWIFEEEEWLFDSNVCANAAFRNQLPVLQWLRANNVPWDEWTLYWARQKELEDVERWALENGCPEPERRF